jgi:hypothetical protein
MGYSTQSIGNWSTWTPTFTGFSSDPVVTFARYTIIGKMCTCILATGNGTSNATSFTVTLPAAAATTGAQKGLISPVVNNGAALTAPGRIDTSSGSNVATLYSTIAANAWTAASTKRAEFIFTYEIQ